MSQPTAYDKTFQMTEQDFDETLLAKLDTEFDDIETSLDETHENLALIQRDDGKLANKSVHADALNDSVFAMITGNFNPRGDWATLTEYAAVDMVAYSGVTYVCIVAHTSTDFTTDASNWMAITDATTASGLPFENTGTGLTAGDVQGAIEEVHENFGIHEADSANPHNVTAAQALALAIAQNLADLDDAVTARANLGLGSAAVEDVSAFEAADADIMRSNVTSTLTKGFNITGTAGSTTPSVATRNLQTLTIAEAWNVPLLTDGGGLVMNVTGNYTITPHSSYKQPTGSEEYDYSVGGGATLVLINDGTNQIFCLQNWQAVA